MIFPVHHHHPHLSHPMVQQWLVSRSFNNNKNHIISKIWIIIYRVIKKHRSAQSLRHFCADGFLSNSTIPSPIDFPRSSTRTTARSTSPKNCSNACLSNSFETLGVKFLTLTIVFWLVKRKRNFELRKI